MLAQRYVDHYRRYRREIPLDEDEESTAASNAETISAGDPGTRGAMLSKAVEGALRELSPEDRFLLTAYYLDGRTLRELAPLLMTHSTTVHRRLERLMAQLRKRVLKGLRQTGLDRRQAAEMLSFDVRDLDIPLKKILQFSSSQTFPMGEVIEADRRRQQRCMTNRLRWIIPKPVCLPHLRIALSQHRSGELLLVHLGECARCRDVVFLPAPTRRGRRTGKCDCRGFLAKALAFQAGHGRTCRMFSGRWCDRRNASSRSSFAPRRDRRFATGSATVFSCGFTSSSRKTAAKHASQAATPSPS